MFLYLPWKKRCTWCDVSLLTLDEEMYVVSCFSTYLGRRDVRGVMFLYLLWMKRCMWCDVSLLTLDEEMYMM